MSPATEVTSTLSPPSTTNWFSSDVVPATRAPSGASAAGAFLVARELRAVSSAVGALPSITMASPCMFSIGIENELAAT